MEDVVVDKAGDDDVADKAREGEERRECLPVATATEDGKAAAVMTIPSAAAPGN
jgi:hypothetical protein